MILNYEYLWINLRVKGGAYGCMCSFNRNGGGAFVSYRDPNLERTFSVYRDIPDYLRSFDVSERDMTNYVIGAIGELDHPTNPSAEGAFSLLAYMSRVTDEMLQKEREEVLSTDVAEIRRLADYVQAVLDCDQICVIGNAGKIEEEKELFGRIAPLN